MRAWQVQRLGPPADVVAQVELPEPISEPDRVLIDMDAVCVGFPDYLMAQGLYHDKPELPFGLGGESVGTVVTVGDGLRGVAGLEGVQPGARTIVLGGRKGDTLLTERVSARGEQLLPIPQDMPAGQAASLYVAYQTSYVGLFRRARLVSGETILIHGASGGVGLAAVQLAKAAGAAVIAVAGGETKAAACREAGADHVIDHTRQDFVEVVKELTDGRGVDVVYDPVGGEVFDKSRRLLAVEGRLLVVGFASGTIPSAPVNHALLKNYSVVGMRMRPFREDRTYHRWVHDQLIEMYQAGTISPVATTFDFDDLPAALELIGSRQVIGRVVVRAPGR